MQTVFRTRPANLKTIEEIEDHYLWFSRPSAYQDTKDANVFAFVKDNESIADALERLFGGYGDIAEQSAKVGICCFTEKMPTQFALRFYPGARNGMVIEYDKDVLQEHFARRIGLGDCFKKVEYRIDPTLFASTSGADILWQQSRNINVYKGIWGILSDPKLTDEFFLKMFTRITKKYRYQKESRIILAGRNIPDESDMLVGYPVKIPKGAIRCIHLHKNCKKEIKDKVLQLGYPVVDMVK